MSCVIWGLLSPKDATISAKPAVRIPNGSTSIDFLPANSVSTTVAHAMNCMVSNPLLIGT